MSATCARASVHAPRASPARRGASARRAVRSRVVAATAAATTTDRDVAIVTGGAKGIGAACCELLAEQGWAVVVNHRASGGHALAHEADVGVEADVVAMFDAAAAYGVVKGLVNNAGILMGSKGSKSVADADADDLEQIMRVNLVGPVLCCREAVRVMSSQNDGAGGAIVNVSSGSAVIGRPLLYAASKGALNSFQAGAVDELAAHGIRINAVSPGMTDTELVADVVPTFDFSKIPLGRMGAPKEIAEGVCFLLGEKGSYVSGANLRIAGGRAPGTFLG